LTNRATLIRTLPLLLFVALCLAWAPGAVAQRERVPPWRASLPTPPDQARITVGTTPLTVQLAITASQQSLGLGYRNGLEADTGMLFVFDQPQIQTFWMKGMRFCLDIVWVTDGRIVGAAENTCPDPAGIADVDRPVQTSSAPVQYVLEVPGGWLKAHGYGAGTNVDLSAVPAPATPAVWSAAPRL
jgi:uncharacterized protein